MTSSRIVAEPETSILAIFATPFATVQMNAPADLNAELSQLFELRAGEEYRDRTAAPNPLYFRSRADLLDWPEESVQTLKRAILAKIAGVVAAVNLYTGEQFGDLLMQARGWYSIVRHAGHVPASTYPKATWCGIYCVAAVDPAPDRSDSGILRLYEPRLANSLMDASNCRMRLPFAYGHHTWTPVAGSMAVFPAANAHEITLVRGTGALVLVTVKVRFATPTQEGLPGW